KAGRGFAAEGSEKLIQHIGKLISLMRLPENEVLLLQSLSRLPVFAFETDTLKGWLNLDNAVTLNSLVKKSLLSKSILKDDRKSYLLHDILARAVRQVYDIQLNDQKSQQFIQEVVDTFGDYGSLKISEKLILEALLLHGQKNFDDKKGNFNVSLGLLYFYTAQYPQALPYLETSLAICQEIDDKAGEGAVLNNISQIYKAQGDYTIALTYLTDSLTICQEIGDKAGEGATLNNISQIYKAQGDYITALTYFTDSLTIFREIGNKAGESTTLNNISQIYQAQGDYTTALIYLTDSLTICQEIGNKAVEGTTLNNISQIYQAQGDYTTALIYLTDSLTICQEIGNKAGEGRALFNMGLIYYETGKKQQGLACLQSAKKIAQEIGNFELNQALNGLPLMYKI
ncbi:tetratricopeptide repeat protein, partial [Bathymodiolus thermophilus thioautotrophic gill symbiont]